MPLLFPCGDLGYEWRRIQRTRATRTRQHVTRKEWAAYHLQVFSKPRCYLHANRRLFQQFIVSNYATIEQERLQYIVHHQQELRRDTYQGVVDHLHNGDDDAAGVGQRVILPSSFTGSPRAMYQHFLVSV